MINGHPEGDPKGHYEEHLVCKGALNLLVGYNEGVDCRVEYNEGFEGFAGYRCRALSHQPVLTSCCQRQPTDNWSTASFIHNSSMNSSSRGQG